MGKPAKEKLLKTWNDAKTGIAATATLVAHKTKKAINETRKRIQTQIDKSNLEKQKKHQAKLDAYRDSIRPVKRTITNEGVKQFLRLLGKSPTDLFDKSVKSIKNSFPIPVEQTILWASTVTETNRTGGIVVTERGVFTKSVVTVFEENALKKEDRKISQLAYYPWEMFDPEWFMNEDAGASLSLSEEKLARFKRACQKYNETIQTRKQTAAHYYSEASADVLAGSASVALSGALKFTRDNGVGNFKNGHGLFAEQANTMIDRLQGHRAKVIGGDNAKDGPDRLVDGINIQTKSCVTGAESVKAAFDSPNHLYRYYNADGSAMKLEVPKGQYDEAVRALKQRIIDGKVPGVTDPSEAERMVIESHFTYQQLVNMAKPGTIESLTYDVATGAVVSTCVFGISFLINAFLSYRVTHNPGEAVLDGLASGGLTSALTLGTHVLTCQLSRTEFFSQIMSKNVIKSGVPGAIAGFLVFSIPDTVKVATRKISGAQYAANLVTLSASIIGGVVGKATGSALGTTIGTAAGLGVGSAPLGAVGFIGGAVGGLAAGTAAGVGTSKLINVFYEGDDARYARLFHAISCTMMNEYLLDESEMDAFIKKMDTISPRKLAKLFQSIHKSKEQEKTIRDFLTPYFDEIVSKRQVFVPALACLA